MAGKKRVQQMIRDARARCDSHNFDSTKEQVACHLGVLFMERDLVHVGLAGRRLGHITDAERKLANQSVDEAMHACAREFKQGKTHHMTCVKGVSAVRYELQKRGLY